MPSARHSAVAKAPAEALWQRLADLESWPRWLRVPYAGERVAITSDSPTGAGTEFVLKGRLPARLFARITEWQEARLLAFEIYRSEYPSDRLVFGRANIRIELEEAGEGRTRVTCRHELEGRGLAGRLYAATVMRPFLSSSAHGIVDSLIASV